MSRTVAELFELILNRTSESEFTPEETREVSENRAGIQALFSAKTNLFFQVAANYQPTTEEIYRKWREEKHLPELSPDSPEFKKKLDGWLQMGMLRDPVG